MLTEEGLEKAWARHRRHHDALVAGLEAHGPEACWSTRRTACRSSTSCRARRRRRGRVRAEALERYDLEIGAGLGALAGKVWRVGLMGTSCTQDNVDLCLDALGALVPESAAK